MSAGAIVGICIGGAIGLFILFLILRTALTVPPKEEKSDYVPIAADDGEIAERLAEAVRIPTVSVQGDVGDFSAFDDYVAFLERTYPRACGAAEKTVINKHSIIYKIAGTDESLLPACFLSHQDVVPANAEDWSVDPFAGIIEDGFVYGRGSLDMKGHMITLLEGLERFLENEKPRRSIYLCFGHDEELTGLNGANKIVEYFLEKGIRTEYVIDEGGIIMDGAILGIKGKLATIGTCEKGYIDVKLSVTKEGGHASSPKKHSSIDILTDSLYVLSRMPMKAYWSKPAKVLCKTVAPYMNFGYRLLFANRDVLSPLLKFLLCKLSPITNSLMRTTFAFTQLQGSDATNVIPNTASAVVNVRVNPGQTTEQVLKYIKKVVGKNVDVSVIGRAFEPVGSGEGTSETYKQLAASVKDVFGYFSTPYPFIAASDAKYYNKISDNVLRFGPLEMEEEDQNRIHSKDERCKIAALGKGAQFFYRFIERTCK